MALSAATGITLFIRVNEYMDYLVPRFITSRLTWPFANFIGYKRLYKSRDAK
jgi:hypothetical protein